MNINSQNTELITDGISITVAENGVIVNCTPRNRAFEGKQFVFTNSSDFSDWMADWFDATSKVDSIISAEERAELCRTNGNKDN